MAENYQPVSQDYPGYRGDTFGPWPLAFKRTGGDFTGATISVELKRKTDGPVEKTFVLSPVVTLAGERVDFNLELPASETELLSGTYFYDIQVEFSGGEVRTPLKGQITFQKDITDSV